MDPLANPPAAIHVDLDGASDILRAWGMDYAHAEDPVFETGLRRFLDLFDRNAIRATFFLIASTLDDPRKRSLVEETLRRGHDVASHTVTHRNLRALDSDAKRWELAESRARIEAALGVRVQGFRAPGYRLDRECFQLLAELGYQYDASAFPTPDFARQLREPLDRLVHPRRPVDGSAFLALPMPDHRPLPVPFNPSYTLLLDKLGLGMTHFRSGLARYRRAGRPLVFLFHLVDLADPLPRALASGFRSRFFTLSHVTAERKLALCQAMLDSVRASFRVVPTGSLLNEVRASLVAAPS